MEYEHLDAKFLEAMNDISRYGHDKWGDDSFQERAKRGVDPRGDIERTKPEVIAEHAAAHFQAYLDGIPHDHFNTRRHQLAASAYNAMMEYIMARIHD
jgi:hypothetical protein